MRDVLGVDSDDALAAALAYAALGWRVVPTPSESKHPRLPAWQDIATSDDEQIIDWWGSLYHTDGISIVCGPSGLVVIDVDRHGAIDGEDSLADLEATLGKLPDCPVVLTGGGGRHLYFRAPEGVTITNDAGRRLGPGLDVRAHGGQVVAPPSLHASGRRYQWEASSLPSNLGLFEVRPGYLDVPDLPERIVDLLLSEPFPVRRPEPQSPPRANGQLPGQQWAAVTDWASLLGDDGARLVGVRTDHRTANTYELWARPGVEHTSATLGYGGSDVLKVFTSNWAGLDEGATYTKFGYLAATRHGGDFRAARAALEADGYTFKPQDVARFLDPEQLIAKADPGGHTPRTKQERLAGLRNAAWLQQQDFPPLRFHVPHIVPEGSTLLVGAPKVGKSWLVLGWSLHIAAGARVLGVDVVPSRPVLYLALEDSHRRLQGRLRQLILPGQPFPPRLDYLTEVDPAEIVDTITDWLDDHAHDEPLVILDTLGKVLPPAVPGESSYMRDYRISGALKRMIDRVDGASLVINHHDRKAGAEDFVDTVSGTHGLAGAADTIVVLTRPRHSADGLIQVTGRDVDEGAYAVTFQRGTWSLVGGSYSAAAAAAEQRRVQSGLGDRTLSVLDALEDEPGGMRYADVEARVGFQPGKALRRLVETGRARKASRGLYVISETSPSETSDTPSGASGARSTDRAGPRGVSEVSEHSGSEDVPTCRFGAGFECLNGPSCPNPNHRGTREPTTDGGAS